ncbi:MAG: hypothetical protein LIP01_06285 [Tannerellaceae bacterium]|nr:hypothetical protein [Tannerellaceae bacterium]
MYKLPDTLTDDIQSIDSLIKEYTAGKIEEGHFKAIRVPMGIYEQRKNGTYMVRVRCTGGYITPQQLQATAETALKAGVPFLHLTTRQEIQLHYVTLDKVKEILETLQGSELGTKGGWWKYHTEHYGRYPGRYQ